MQSSSPSSSTQPCPAATTSSLASANSTTTATTISPSSSSTTTSSATCAWMPCQMEPPSLPLSSTVEVAPRPPPSGTAPLQDPCLGCRLAKVKCERRQPCNRCVRLEMDCTVQIRKRRGRPLKHGTERRETGEGPQSRLARPARSRGRAVKRPRDPMEQEEKEEVIYKSIIPSECMMVKRAVIATITAFSRMDEEGSLDDGRVVNLLSEWRNYRRKTNKDISAGVYDAITGIISTRRVMTTWYPDPNLDLDREAPPVTVEQCKDDGDSGNWYANFLPGFIKLLNVDRQAAIVGHIYHDGEYYNFVNSRFADMFFTVGELDHQLRNVGIANTATWSRILHPDELEDFYSALLTHYLTPPRFRKEMSIVCRCVDKFGREVLSLLRVRNVILAVGKGAAIILSVYPMPPSRYLSTTPATSTRNPQPPAAVTHQTASIATSEPSQAGRLPDYHRLFRSRFLLPPGQTAPGASPLLSPPPLGSMQNPTTSQSADHFHDHSTITSPAPPPSSLTATVLPTPPSQAPPSAFDAVGQAGQGHCPALTLLHEVFTADMEKERCL